MINFLKQEFYGFNKFEKIFFPTILLLTAIISILTNDNKIALISALAGMSYTILAGKGKILCYFIGLTGTFCYCYIAYKNALYGNLALYGLYFFPMQIIGIFAWIKHLKKETREIIKTKLTQKERMIYGLILTLLIILFAQVLKSLNGNTPYIDSITTILSIFAQYLTIKRCIEQWYFWLIVNVLSLYMWIIAYLNNSNCLATIIMWSVYTFLAIYFLIKWKKELAISNLDNNKL